jgi:signal transduction histidine kinase
LIGRVVRSRRALAEELQQTIDALEVERAAYVELAVERERRYIARELHDIVGHAMSLITIQAAAGRHLTRTDPARAAGALDAIVDAGLQARVEVGRLRGVLEDSAPPGLDRAAVVIAQAAAAGLEIRVRGRPASIDLAPEVDAAAFRVLQEALTNVVKHAGGAEVDVALEVHDAVLSIAVRNGPGRDAADAGDGGHGLRGMADRVHAAGGDLSAGPSGDGWQVLATLPVASGSGV